MKVTLEVSYPTHTCNPTLTPTLRYLRERRSAYQEVVLDRAGKAKGSPTPSTPSTLRGAAAAAAAVAEAKSEGAMMEVVEEDEDEDDEEDVPLADLTADLTGWRTEGSPYIGERLTRTVDISATGTTEQVDVKVVRWIELS